MASKSLNKVFLIGHLGADPEVKFLQDGTSCATLSIATNEPYKDDNDKWQTRPEWHRVVAWRRHAEIAAEYLSKGKQVYVEGRLQTRSWDDKDGIKRYTTEVVVRDIILLGGRDDVLSQSQRPPHPADDVSESEEQPF